MASDRPIPRKSSWESSLFEQDGAHLRSERDRNELHFSHHTGSAGPSRFADSPNANGRVMQHRQVTVPFPAADETTSPTARDSMLPERPPKILHRRSTTPTLIVHQPIVHQPIVRKPVGRASISEPSSSRPDAAMTVTRMNTISTMPISTTTALRSTYSTRDLFTQASNSLQNLADDTRTLQLQDDRADPPPYELPPPIPPRDVKRRESVLSYVAPQSDSIFQMITENRIEAVQKSLEAGVGINELDPDRGRTPIM